MTEDEAKTKWCPFARDSETAGNRSQAAPDKIHFPCIASACMAWRWTGRTEIGREGYYGDEVMIRYEASVRGGDGHCGLAGQPS